MACIQIGEFAGFEVQTGREYGDEHTGFVVFTQYVVDDAKCFAQIFVCLDFVFDLCFGRHHKQCGGNAFARNICDDDAQRIRVDHKEIIGNLRRLPGRCTWTPQYRKQGFL